MSIPTMKKLAATSKRDSSSATTPASMPVRPWPPNSRGQWGAAQPASALVRCQVRAISSWAASWSSVFARNARQSPSPSPRGRATERNHAPSPSPDLCLSRGVVDVH